MRSTCDKRTCCARQVWFTLNTKDYSSSAGFEKLKSFVKNVTRVQQQPSDDLRRYAPRTNPRRRRNDHDDGTKVTVPAGQDCMMQLYSRDESKLATFHAWLAKLSRVVSSSMDSGPS